MRFNDPRPPVRDTALALLRAVGADDGAVAAAGELAKLVLARREVALALKVLDGGAHTLRRAIELAGIMLDDAPEQTTTGTDGESR